ncbi:MAG: hypothetical protein WAW86_00655 [Gammaproteobacteria bacterium]
MGKPDQTHKDKEKKVKKHKKKAAAESAAPSQDNSHVASSEVHVLDGSQFLGKDPLFEIPPRKDEATRKARRKKKHLEAESDQTEAVLLTPEIVVPVATPAPDLNIAPEAKASCCSCFSFFRKKPEAETKPLLQTNASKMNNS